MKSLSQSQKDNITSALLHTTHSHRQIASKIGVSSSSVDLVARQVLPDKENLKGGRPKKLSQADKRFIREKLNLGRADNVVQVTRDINNVLEDTVHPQTVRNALTEDDFKPYVKQSRPLLSARHIKKRLEFALKYESWTVADWKRVLWSDETKINRVVSDGKKYIWQKKGTKFNERRVKKTVKHGGGCIMVWGCMGWNGVGGMVEVEGRMNKEQYTSIPEGSLRSSMENLGLSPEEAIFQQDGDPKHTSGMALGWLEDHDIKVLDWPAQSPDLNPIERLWNHIKSELKAFEKHPKGVHELWDRAAEVWGQYRAYIYS